MARLPIYTNRQSVGTGSQFQRPISGSNAVGRGVQNLARGINDLGAAFNAAEEKANKFAAEKELIEYETRSQETLRSSAENDLPEDGRGFYKGTLSVIGKDLEDTLKRIDPSLREEYTIKLLKRQQNVGEAAARIEVGKRKEFIQGVTTQKIEQLAGAVQEGFSDRATAKAEMETFIKENGFRSEMAGAIRRSIGRAVDAAFLENAKRNRPNELFKDLERFRMTGAAKGVKGVPLQIIQHSRLHDADPAYMLMVSNIETSFNPYTTASKTIAGPFQMTAETRRQYGVPERLKFDIAANTAAFARLTRDNEIRLRRNGYKVTNTSRWGMHFLGAGGYLAFRSVDPNADAYSVYRSVAGRNRAGQAFNGSNGALLRRGMTVGQVLRQIERKVAKGERAVAGMVGPETASGEEIKQGEIVVLGEKLENATPADLMKFYMESKRGLQESSEREQRALNKEVLTRGDGGSGSPYDPAWRKQADDASEPDRMQIAEGDTETISKYMTVAKKGYLPRPIAESAAQLLNSPDPASRATGYELLATTHYVDPSRGLDHSKVPAEIKKKVELYAAIRATTGATPAQAAAEVNERYSEEYRKRLKKAEGADSRSKLVGDRTWNELEGKLALNSEFLFGLLGEDKSPITDAAKRKITGLYQRRFDHYLNTGDDEDTAVTKAAADIGRVHGETQVLGRSRFMMYPPENYYPPGADGTHKYIQRQALKIVNAQHDRVREELNQYRKQRGQAAYPDDTEIKIEDVEIVASQQSGLDFLGRSLPRYVMYYRDPLTDEIEMVPGARPFDPAEQDLDVGVAPERPEPAPTKTEEKKSETPDGPRVNLKELREKREERRATEATQTSRTLRTNRASAIEERFGGSQD